MQQFTIPANSQQSFQILPLSSNEKPAKVFGKITFDIEPKGGALLLPSDDGSTLVVQSVADMDFQTITISGEATATAGEKVVTTPFQVRTLGAVLDHFGISAGAIEVLP